VGAILAAMALVLAACGNEDGDSAAVADTGTDEGEAAVDEGDDDAAEDGAAASGFFDGQLLHVTIPFGEGGSGDYWGRTFAAEIVNYLEGDVRSQPENVPGAGSILGTNQFFNSDGSDGTRILFAASSTTVAWMLGQDEIDFDLAQAYPILGIPGNTITHVRSDSGYTSMEEIVNAEPGALLFGGRTPETGADTIVFVGHEVLGITEIVRPVFGYENLGAIQLAMDQGEVQFSSRNTDSMVECCMEQLDDGTFVNLYTAGLPDATGDLVRDPIFPDVPTLAEVYEELYGEQPSGDAWEAFKALRELTGSTAFFFMAHPDTPPEALAELQQAATEMANDPAFLELVSDRILEYDFVTGDDLDATTEAFQNVDPDVTEWIRNFLATEFDASF
jgi:hypothetical protein